MLAILYALGMFIADLFKSRTRLEAENVFLRYQLNLALRQKPSGIRLRGSDRHCWFGWSDCGQACLTRSTSFSLKQSFVGIALELGPSGGGNLGIGQGGQRPIASFAN
jgi:hypothetical protein